MASYMEKEDKNELILSANDKREVKITMTGIYGATAGLSFISPNHSQYIEVGTTVLIDNVASLKSEGSIFFSCDADNYGGLAAVIEFKIFEVKGRSITYRFPDDFTGTPNVPGNEDSPLLSFKCNFK